MQTSPEADFQNRVQRALEIPRALRAFVRARESSLVVVAAAVGGLAGLGVVAMSFATNLLHWLFFRIPWGQRLSAADWVDPTLAVAVPTVGGLLFGLALVLVARWRPMREVDPIEANALHGGRMSLRGSLNVVLQTIWSCGVGASVGLEAGYTQLGGGIASRIGQAFHLRRQDLRILVGCGTAGAIAGAFGAPLAGAFYGFELVIGTYSVAGLTSVGIAALTGYLVVRGIDPASLGIETVYVSHVTASDLGIAAGVGLAAAGVGILVMRGVGICEPLLNRLKIKPYLRPALGGALVGGMALVTPHVLGSGHGAIHIAAMIDLPMAVVAVMFLLKCLASIVSLGTNFRGGLFFTSLLIGALGGRLFANLMSAAWPSLGLDPHIYAIIGMGALSASVIGAPLTMTFIALETTGDFWLTAAVLIAVIISTQVTRELFGYSFATWRFHLRGETIRSAADIGWLRELTVRRMMRTDMRTVAAHTTIGRFRLVYPLGSTAQAVAVDEHRRYAGIAIVAEVHSSELDPSLPIKDVLRYTDIALLPNMTVKEAVAAFDQAEAEALAVIDSLESRRVIGLLSETHTLRRYSEELELQRRNLVGD
ncbi:MAG: chloride channel protein [Xanthobacteraceae bacterium]|jgi:chloride channel protein, CIC family